MNLDDFNPFPPLTHEPPPQGWPPRVSMLNTSCSTDSLVLSEEGVQPGVELHLAVAPANVCLFQPTRVFAIGFNPKLKRAVPVTLVKLRIGYVWLDANYADPEYGLPPWTFDTKNIQRRPKWPPFTAVQHRFLLLEFRTRILSHVFVRVDGYEISHQRTTP